MTRVLLSIALLASLSGVAFAQVAPASEIAPSIGAQAVASEMIGRGNGAILATSEGFALQPVAER